MKKFLVTVLLFLGHFSFAANGLPDHKSAISFYNGLKSPQQVIDLLVQVDAQKNPDDVAFVKELKSSLAGEVLLKAKGSGNKIFLGEERILIEVLNAPAGKFKINDREITITPDKSLRTTFKEIQNALNTKQTKYDFFFGTKAHAAGLASATVISFYGLAAATVGGGCYFLQKNFASEGTDPKKIPATCAKVGLSWPYYAWKLYDFIQNGRDIKEGACVPPGPNSKFGDLVKLRLTDHFTGDKVEIFLKTDASGKPAIYTMGFDRDKKTFEQIQEIQKVTHPQYIGSNENAAIQFIEKLQAACKQGGTTALNNLISSDSKVKNGLTTLVQASAKPGSSPAPSASGSQGTAR